MIWQNELQRELEHKNSMLQELMSRDPQEVVFFYIGPLSRMILCSVCLKHKFRVAINSWLFLFFFQIPTSAENNGCSYPGNPAPSVSGVNIIFVNKTSQYFGWLLYTWNVITRILNFRPASCLKCWDNVIRSFEHWSLLIKWLPRRHYASK